MRLHNFMWQIHHKHLQSWFSSAFWDVSDFMSTLEHLTAEVENTVRGSFIWQLKLWFRLYDVYQIVDDEHFKHVTEDRGADRVMMMQNQTENWLFHESHFQDRLVVSAAATAASTCNTTLRSTIHRAARRACSLSWPFDLFISLLHQWITSCFPYRCHSVHRHQQTCSSAATKLLFFCLTS